MSATRVEFTVGNRKMNGTSAAVAEVRALASGGLPEGREVLSSLPATLITRTAEATRGSGFRVD